MQMYKYFLAISLIFIGCANDRISQSNQPFNASEATVPKIDVATIGNIRIAVIKSQKAAVVVLVNHSNSVYLLPTDESDQPRREIPPSSLKYQAPFLSWQDKVKLVILDDEIMAEMLGLLERVNYYTFATPCSAEDVKKRNWPEQDTIFLENNGKLYAFARPELLDSTQRISEQGKAYVAVKNNILLAQRHGYSPMQIQQRILSPGR